jgi:tRNA G46 methylase TrmB
MHSYDISDYLKSNPYRHIENYPQKATTILKMLQRNNLAPKAVVEIGCGAGEILNQLHAKLDDKTIQFSGYEISPSAFNLTKEREKERLSFY